MTPDTTMDCPYTDEQVNAAYMLMPDNGDEVAILNWFKAQGEIARYALQKFYTRPAQPAGGVDKGTDND